MPRVEFVPLQSLSETDFKRVAEMRMGFFNDMSIRNYGKPEEKEVLENERAWFVRQYNAKKPTTWVILVAKVDGKIAGYHTLNLVAQDKSIRSYESFVLPQFRKPALRLGDRFVLAGLEIGQQHGFTRMWRANQSTTPHNPGVRKVVERIIRQPLGNWPEDYPRSMRAKHPYSKVFFTPFGTAGFTGDPNWARARTIRFRNTKKGFVQSPSLTIPINPLTIQTIQNNLTGVPKTRMPQPLVRVRSRSKIRRRAR